MHATILIKTGPLVAIEGGNKYFPARLDSTCLKTFLLCFYSNMYIQTQLTFFLHTQRKVFFLGYFLLSQHLATPTCKFMGKSFQAAQLTQERFLTIDH